MDNTATEAIIADLTDALRAHAHGCEIAGCGRFAVWTTLYYGSDTYTCDEHKMAKGQHFEAASADTLRGLDGVLR